MMKLPGCICIAPGVPKIFQIRKIQRFDKSGSYFRFDHSVLAEMKVVRNSVLNNLYLNDKLPILLFSLREAKPDLQVEVCETLGAESVDLWPVRYFQKSN